MKKNLIVLSAIVLFLIAPSIFPIEWVKMITFAAIVWLLAKGYYEEKIEEYKRAVKMYEQYANMYLQQLEGNDVN